MGILGDWLPEDPQQNAAARQGLLALGGAMMSSRGENFLGTLGQGLMAGTQGYQGALAQQQQTALRQAQMQQIEVENKQRQAAIDKPGRIASAFSGMRTPGAQPSVTAPGAPGISGPRRLPAVDASLEGYTPRSVADLPRIGETRAASPLPQAVTPEDLFNLYRQRGDTLADLGYTDDAKDMYAFADKQKQELMKRETLTKNGKPVSVLTFKDGREVDSGYDALPDNQIVDMGGTQEIFDKNLPRDGAQFKKTVTPDTIMRVNQDERESRRVDERVRAAAASAAAPNADGMLSDETVAMMAEQYRAGDTSVMQNLGRGAQGSHNIVRLRSEIARQTKEAGQGGRDLAAQNAEYFGTKAGQRSAGTRIANVEMASYEAESLIPLARDASAAVSRSGLLPFGKGQVMFNEQTNSPEMRQFAAANNALVNVYSRAISPSGVPTVADKEHAREMIATAMDDKSYQAVLNQMQKEITAARRAPQQVRRAFNDAVTGKGDHGTIKDWKDLPKKTAPATQAYADAEKERRYQEWKRSQGK